MNIHNNVIIVITLEEMVSEPAMIEATEMITRVSFQLYTNPMI